MVNQIKEKEMSVLEGFALSLILNRHPEGSMHYDVIALCLHSPLSAGWSFKFSFLLLIWILTSSGPRLRALSLMSRRCG